MPDPRNILDDIVRELEERGVQPRPLAILANAADRGIDGVTIEALAELLAEAEAVAA
jgi:hypothetical protein